MDTSASGLSIGGGVYHSTLESESAGSVSCSSLSEFSSSETIAESKVMFGEIVKADKNA